MPMAAKTRYQLLREKRGRADADRSYDLRRGADPRLAEAKRIRSTAQWQKVRAAQLAAHPLCADPFGYHTDRPLPARQVHHVKPLIERPDLAFDASNLASLCVACHAQIEALSNDKTKTLEYLKTHEKSAVSIP